VEAGLRVLAGREGSSRGQSDSGAPGVAHGQCAPGPCARAAPERGVSIVDQIIQGVLNEVCEYFDFDDEDCPA
jgi:hypothetical protein